MRSYAEAVVGRMRAEVLTNIDDVRTVDEKILAQDLKELADSQRQEAKDCEPGQCLDIDKKNFGNRVEGKGLCMEL